VKGQGGYEWTWLDGESDPFEQILSLVAQSAAELLTGEWVKRLGVCDAHGCLWLFIDKSRNRSRRWCDMADCGNQDKVRRFRERARAKEAD
jgi:predicted RNA-binding Zn ribbon-like protein